MTSIEAVAEFEVQGRISPGTEGWWQVWGATPQHIRPGDLVLVQGEKGWTLILDTFTAKAAPLRVGLVDESGKWTLGALCPVAVVRKGTHNTLA